MTSTYFNEKHVHIQYCNNLPGVICLMERQLYISFLKLALIQMEVCQKLNV